MTQEEMYAIFRQLCQRLRDAEDSGEGVLLDSIECQVLAYALRELSWAVVG